MGIEIIQSHKPLWTGKLSDEKLRKYLDAANKYELTGCASELLLDTAETWNIIYLLRGKFKKERTIWQS